MIGYLLCTDNAKVMMGKIPAPYQESRQWHRIVPVVIAVSHTQLKKKKKKPVLLKNALDAVVTMVNFIKSQPLSACLCNSM